VLPPHDFDAESAVIASLLVDPGRVWEVAGTGLEPCDFLREKNVWCFESIIDMANAGESINQISVARELARRGRLDDLGGAYYLSQMVTELPTSVGVESYAKIVHELAQHRALISTAQAMAQDAYAAKDRPADVMARALDRIMAAWKGIRNGRRSLKDMFGDLIDLEKAPAAAARCGSRVSSLQEAIPRLGAGEMAIVAAPPTVGKTAFALNIARNVALGQGKKVAVFSVEMGADALFYRLLSLETGISYDRIISGIIHCDLSDRQWQLINDAGGRLCDAPIEILDSTGWSVQHVGLEARRIQAQKGLDLLIIDYLQLLSSGAVHVDNQTHEVSLVSRALKEMARALAVPVVVVSQLNRNAGEKERPALRHLLQSGSLERDADIVLFLHWTDRVKKLKRPVMAILAKNRNGPQVEVSLTFEATSGRFRDPLEEVVDA
jgi:replicative DNA helicase